MSLSGLSEELLGKPLNKDWGWLDFYRFQYSVERMNMICRVASKPNPCIGNNDISWQEIRASKFDQRPLHPPQQRYAALDAWILLKMLSSMKYVQIG